MCLERVTLNPLLVAMCASTVRVAPVVRGGRTSARALPEAQGSGQELGDKLRARGTGAQGGRAAWSSVSTAERAPHV